MKIYISQETEGILKRDMQKAISKYSNQYHIPLELIKAMIQAESNGNYFSLRYEKHLKKASWYQRTLLGIASIDDYDHCSYGLMQIMYGNARHLGYKGGPFGLYEPDNGIKYACIHLKRCLDRYKWVIEDAVSAYNQGNNNFYDIDKDGIKDKDEKYYNQQYVDKVMGLYRG